MSMNTENNKVVVVTGASSGFGYDVSVKLAKKGYKVFATMRNTKGKNQKVVEELKLLADEHNLDLSIVDIDVTEINSVKSGISSIIEKTNRIDVLINNAGTIMYGVNEGFSMDQIQDVFDVNLFGVIRMNNEILPYMRKQKSGLLIHISSVIGKLVVPSMGVYSSSKFALEALAETYRYDLAGSGVDSVLINPGGYPTKLYDQPEFPDKSEIVDHYGDIGHLGEQLHSNFQVSLQDRDIGEVSERIIEIIEMNEQRPLRSGIGPESQFITSLLKQSSDAQSNLLNAFGMTQMAPLAK